MAAVQGDDLRLPERVQPALHRRRVEGRAELIQRLLTRRFGTLSQEADAQIQNASIDELDAIGDRLLTAKTLQQVLIS